MFLHIPILVPPCIQSVAIYVQKNRPDPLRALMFSWCFWSRECRAFSKAEANSQHALCQRRLRGLLNHRSVLNIAIFAYVRTRGGMIKSEGPFSWQAKTIKASPSYAWSRSEHSFACFTYCWNFCLSSFAFSVRLRIYFPQPSLEHEVTCVMNGESEDHLWLGEFWFVLTAP